MRKMLFGIVLDGNGHARPGHHDGRLRAGRRDVPRGGRARLRSRVRLFVSDIEVASDMMDAPAYENFARLGALMHASLWRFRGDPDTLVRAYNELVAELPL